MGCCYFRPSISSSSKSKSTLCHVYISPLPKSQISETQLPAEPEVHQVSIISDSVSVTHIVEKRVHFSSRVAFSTVEADSKQSSTEGGESYESLFSLQLVDGWSTSNEEEVMSKEISNNINDSSNEPLDEGFAFPSKNESISLSGVAADEEVSVETSFSSWLVDLEPENSVNSAKDSINEKPKGGSENRRVLSVIEVNENHGQSLRSSGINSRSIGSYLNKKAHATADSVSHSSSIQSVKIGMRVPKEDEKVDLHKALPLGLSLAKTAMCTGIV